MFRPIFRQVRQRLFPFTSIVQTTACRTVLFSTRTSSAATSTPPLLEPIVVLKLNNLRDNAGAVKAKRRVGRGPGSGRGRTCGKGNKGQKSRSGGSVALDFTGGQTKIWRQFPKRGFRNTRHGAPMVGINVGTILDHVEMGRLDASQPITLQAMKEAGIFKANAVKHGVKLLSTGKERLLALPIPLELHVSRASATAIDAIESAGGLVTSFHYNTLALRTILRPEKFDDTNRPKHARPPPKLQPYYTSWHKRGYLNPAVQMRAWFAKQQQEQQEGDAENDVVALEQKFEELMKGFHGISPKETENVNEAKDATSSKL
jgi:large subunit ribosomal protein L15